MPYAPKWEQQEKEGQRNYIIKPRAMKAYGRVGI
jgi:hypothetical protein